MEKVGYHKRDILKSRVLKAKKGQEDTKEEFASALEEFSALINFDGGDLEKSYKKLNNRYEKSLSTANELKDRVASVDKVANDLFREWEKELKQYSNAELKRSSEKQLDATRNKYQPLIASMRKAESKLDPVLSVLKDNVLYLKHNLNAAAIGALKSEVVRFEGKVATLIAEMEEASREANIFIKEL